MSVRVTLRLKHIKPYVGPRRNIYGGPPLIPLLEPDPEFDRLLREAARRGAARRWASTPAPGLPDPRFTPTCTMNVPPGVNLVSGNGEVQ